jgi:hypothetical protein
MPRYYAQLYHTSRSDKLRLFKSEKGVDGRSKSRRTYASTLACRFFVRCFHRNSGKPEKSFIRTAQSWCVSQSSVAVTSGALSAGEEILTRNVRTTLGPYEYSRGPLPELLLTFRGVCRRLGPCRVCRLLCRRRLRPLWRSICRREGRLLPGLG